MRFQGLSFRCKCGRRPFRITEVGLTSDHQLLVLWWCVGCRKMAGITKPLSECWRECPKHATSKRTMIEGDGYAGTDADFLAAIGVIFPEDR
jgi:hypothetical protein